MLHPLLNSKKAIYAFITLWVTIAVVHAKILWYQYNFSFEIAAADSLVFTVLYALISLGLWYAVRFNGIDSKNYYSLAINHIITAFFVVTVWGYLGSLIMLNVIKEPIYLAFLPRTMIYRSVFGLMFYVWVVLFYYLLIYYNAIQEKVQIEASLKTSLKEAELQMLRSQINPHFLFNSLNSISSLTLSKPEKAREMIIKLSEFMRYSLKNKDDRMVEFREELYNIEYYLDIERVRFGSRLIYNADITSDTEKCNVPSMILQPLVENAIKHGVFSSSEQVNLILKARIEDNMLIIRVSNDFDSETTIVKGTGTGLTNIKKRMALLFGSEDLVQIKKSDKLFIVEICVPLQAKGFIDG